MCLSSYGWDDCKDKVKTLFCSSYEDRCGKAVMEMKSFGRATEFYGKSCTTSEECSQRKCDSLKMGSSATVTKCDIHCCNDDLCNGAQVSMFSKSTFCTSVRVIKNEKTQTNTLMNIKISNIKLF
ncbi:unnamed protein product [Porites evermanni]|uniref:Phospholipase A2 inhibitor N-terminal domain-containing protein n=1 Tax=Porites evermanni TaxID=104178 RepID=A0ABN8MM57_9CNID|nr:unnamed protein product [Porites evermanni]